MKNKIEHTPGPWEMGGSLLASTSGKHIAIVLHNINYDEKKLPRDYDSRAPKNFPETEANARLIAAAPELLAALEKLRDVMQAHNDKQDRAMIQAAAAIAKAKGEK
jgi:hypothetical protein